MPNQTYSTDTGVRQQILRRAVGRLTVVVLLLSACSAGSSEPVTTTEAPSPTDTPHALTTLASVTTTLPLETTEKPFEADILDIDDVTAARMTASWRPGCPVALDDLRLLLIPYMTFSGQTATGEMVVHATHAEDVVAVFEKLFRARYPIERMQLVDEFGADDVESMNANNTSAFNCREVAGQPGMWSEHAYGRALDINPVQNPYVRSDSSVVPDAGETYVERDTTMPGLITDGDVVVDAFAAIGWSWGGNWSSARDYQHFSATGR